MFALILFTLYVFVLKDHQYNENKIINTPRFCQQTLPHWLHEKDDGPIWRKRSDVETANVIITRNQVGHDEVEEEENYYEVIEEYKPEANGVKAEPADTSAIYRPQLPLPRSVCCGNRNLTSKTCYISHSPPPIPKRNKTLKNQSDELVQIEAESTSTVYTNEYAPYTSEESSLNNKSSETSSLRDESSETSFDPQWYADKTNGVREHTHDLDDGSYVIWSDESDNESYVAPDDVRKWTGSRDYEDTSKAANYTPWDTSDDNCYVGPNVLNLDSSREFEAHSANEEYELWENSDEQSESVGYVTQDNVLIWTGENLEADVSTTDTVWCNSSGDCQYVTSNYIINCIGEKVQEVEYSSESLTYLTTPKEYKQSPALKHNSSCPTKPSLPLTTETEYISKETEDLSSELTIHPYERAAVQCWDSIVGKILVRQILPHMHSCISNYDIDRLRNGIMKNDKSAADDLLQLLKSSKELGRWTVFVQALEASGHLIAANILKHKTANYNAHAHEHEKILKLVGPQLRERLKPREVLVHMRALDIITDEDVTEISAIERTSGYICAADQLLSRIPIKHPDWFNRLLTALVDGGYTDLKNILELKQEDEIEKETLQECQVQSCPCLKQRSLTEDPLAHGHAEMDKYDFSSVAGYSTPYNHSKIARYGHTYTNKPTLTMNCNNKERQPCGNVNGIITATEQLTCFETASTSRMQHRCPPEFYEMNNEDASERHKLQILNVKVKSEETICRCKTLTQSRPIELKKENNPNETFDIDELKQEIERDNEQCEMLDRKIELLREKIAVKSMLDRKKKEVEALKAAISGEVTYDCYSKYGLGSSLHEMAIYTSPNRISGKMTLDYRDTDAYSVSSFPELWPGLENFELTPYKLERVAIQPRSLLDYRHYGDIDLYQCKWAPDRHENNRTRNVLVMDSLYNDSAYYSETNYSARSQSLYNMV